METRANLFASWQCHCERGAFSFDALHGNQPAMGLDDRFGDVEAEAEASVVSTGDVAGAMKALEELRNLIAWDADALIDHRRLHRSIPHPDQDIDFRTVRRVLDRI